jgi:pullulanase/glycogen debranching enzyme
VTVSKKGRSSPLGATPSPNGVNFGLFSRHATGVQLLLFDAVDDTRTARVILLDPSANRTYFYWHVFVPNVRPGQVYAYRVEGPFHPRCRAEARGQRRNGHEERRCRRLRGCPTRTASTLAVEIR